MLWLSKLLTHVRHGKNAFILTGAIGDLFPGSDAAAPDALLPWHVIAMGALREVRPKNAMFWSYDIARGFTYGEDNSEKHFCGIIEEESKKNTPPPPKGSGDVADAIQKARKTKPAKDRAAQLPFIEAAESMTTVMLRAALAGTPCVALLHDLDAAWNTQGGGGGGDGEPRLRAFLQLMRLANTDVVRRAGSIIVLAAPSTGSLPEVFRRKDSPFTVIEIGLPGAEERGAFLGKVCRDPSAPAEPEETEAEDPEPLENLPPPTHRKFSRQLWAETMQAANDGYKPMTQKLWNKLEVGDGVVFRRENDPSPVNDYLKVVLKCGKDGVVLSDATDLMKPSIPNPDSAPILHSYYDDKGIQQRANPSCEWKPMFGGKAKEKVRYKIGYSPAKVVGGFLSRLDRQNALLERERLSNVDKVAAEIGPVPKPFEPFETPTCGIPTAARITCGMSYRDIIGVLRVSQSEQRPCGPAEIHEARRIILDRAYGHLFDVVEPERGFDDIAGNDHIKEFFYQVVRNILAGHIVKVPQGALISGPPGTGKSAIAEAFAKECGLLLVKMKNMRSMWLGETERQIEEALAALMALAPLALFRDEVDQEDSGRDAYQGDSGTSGRIRQALMTFLAKPEIRGRVFCVSATNRPDLLDAALKRSGRTDERLVMLMPDPRTRSALLDVMFRRVTRGLDGVKLAWDAGNTRREVVRGTRGLTGADIEVIARHALDFAPAENGIITIKPEHLLKASTDFMGNDAVEQIARMELAAIMSVSRDSYRPRNWKDIVARHQATLRGEICVDEAEEDLSFLDQRLQLATG